MKQTAMTTQERAGKSARAMMDQDTASTGLGMRLDEIAPGRAVMSMEVAPHMLNGHRICHGGFNFALADSAFACNSYNQVTVAQQNQTTYLCPGQPGERLTAIPTETTRTGRSGVYDVTVTGADGRAVALFRGLPRSVRGQNVPEEEPIP